MTKPDIIILILTIISVAVIISFIAFFVFYKNRKRKLIIYAKKLDGKIDELTKTVQLLVHNQNETQKNVKVLKHQIKDIEDIDRYLTDRYDTVIDLHEIKTIPNPDPVFAFFAMKLSILISMTKRIYSRTSFSKNADKIDKIIDRTIILFIKAAKDNLSEDYLKFTESNRFYFIERLRERLKQTIENTNIEPYEKTAECIQLIKNYITDSFLFTAKKWKKQHKIKKAVEFLRNS